jgi:hypothetical protein
MDKLDITKMGIFFYFKIHQEGEKTIHTIRENIYKSNI